IAGVAATKLIIKDKRPDPHSKERRPRTPGLDDERHDGICDDHHSQYLPGQILPRYPASGGCSSADWTAERSPLDGRQRDGEISYATRVAADGAHRASALRSSTVTHGARDDSTAFAARGRRRGSRGERRV